MFNKKIWIDKFKIFKFEPSGQMATYAKYMDRYKRMRSASTEARGDWAFKSGGIVDRETYTKFMELELEKVSF